MQALNNSIVYSLSGKSNLTTIVNSSIDVDILLTDFNDLIDNRYKPWFAKRFYAINRGDLQKYASVARADGTNPERYFARLVGNHYNLKRG